MAPSSCLKFISAFVEGSARRYRRLSGATTRCKSRLRVSTITRREVVFLSKRWLMMGDGVTELQPPLLEVR